MDKNDMILIAQELADNYKKANMGFDRFLTKNHFTYLGAGVETRAYKYDYSDWVLLVTGDPVKQAMSEMDTEYLLDVTFVTTFTDSKNFYIAPYYPNVIKNMVYNPVLSDVQDSEDIPADAKAIISSLYNCRGRITDIAGLEVFLCLDVPETMVNELYALAKKLLENNLTVLIDLHFGNYALHSGELIILDPFVT